ncbi:MAG: PEGA domain-containing protein [Flammeovirgaceae bacterium TMED290]|nr:MAG: PEGA domain-containing protein [Flammeovirgaceae bacterium TMED290]|tara:strand:+ start:1636 stop:1992 length:357 start_codon:yes stop_codon:yes gene_type:complete
MFYIPLFFILNNCSTILSGTKSIIFIDSKPNSAEVFISGLHIGKTPVRYRLEKSFNGAITIEKKGYQKKYFRIPKSFNMISILNTIFVYAWVIDIATGSIKKFDQKVFGFNLEKKRDE